MRSRVLDVVVRGGYRLSGLTMMICAVYALYLHHVQHARLTGWVGVVLTTSGGLYAALKAVLGMRDGEIHWWVPVRRVESPGRHRLLVIAFGVMGAAFIAYAAVLFRMNLSGRA